MKLHIITIGQPKLDYARSGWQEYEARLRHYHQFRVTHLPDKQNDTKHILEAAGSAYKVALEVTGQQFSSHDLALFLEKQALAGKEATFIIGGPTGLPPEVLKAADLHWSLSQLTFPHDLAMVILLETLYRASTINAGHPYHK
ncbi:MAG TPA: 23S rRNA (pseudouridine(1915)-N(3))-methyltransferase RlmH [Verrucomicrobiae bacterium]|nr:23S rRNA (pseudouridine(1915)-N(3))-methyltransferase RlmH [Verrucomicrobiae bacterium]